MNIFEEDAGVDGTEDLERNGVNAEEKRKEERMDACIPEERSDFSASRATWQAHTHGLHAFDHV